MRAAAPPRRLGAGRATSLLLVFLWITSTAADEEVSGWFGDGGGVGESRGGEGEKTATATTTTSVEEDGTPTPLPLLPPQPPPGPPPDCRVCSAQPAPLWQCPAGLAPCGLEGVYSLRARWRCGGGEAEAETHALSSIAAASIGPHPGRVGLALPGARLGYNDHSLQSQARVRRGVPHRRQDQRPRHSSVRCQGYTIDEGCAVIN
jgi:hypothetical protein